jgi:hypothetical protein
MPDGLPSAPNDLVYVLSSIALSNAESVLSEEGSADGARLQLGQTDVSLGRQRSPMTSFVFLFHPGNKKAAAVISPHEIVRQRADDPRVRRGTISQAFGEKGGIFQ